jgi:hypothetical protein
VVCDAQESPQRPASETLEAGVRNRQCFQQLGQGYRLGLVPHVRAGQQRVVPKLICKEYVQQPSPTTADAVIAGYAFPGTKPKLD